MRWHRETDADEGTTQPTVHVGQGACQYSWGGRPRTELRLNTPTDGRPHGPVLCVQDDLCSSSCSFWTKQMAAPHPLAVLVGEAFSVHQWASTAPFLRDSDGLAGNRGLPVPRQERRSAAGALLMPKPQSS